MLVQRLVRLTTLAALVVMAAPAPTQAKPGKPQPGVSKTKPGTSPTNAAKAVMPRIVSRHVPCFDFANVRNGVSYMREIGGCWIGDKFNHIDLALTLEPPTAESVRLNRVRCWAEGTDPSFKNRIKARLRAIENPNVDVAWQTLVEGSKSFQGGRGELSLILGEEVHPNRFHYVLDLEWRDGNSQGKSRFEGCRVDWAVYD